LSCEIYLSSRVPTLFCEAEGHITEHAMRVLGEPCAVIDPRHAWKLHTREPGDPMDVHSYKLRERLVKATNRTTNMHVCGESDEWVVPTKCLNKEATEYHRNLSGEH